MEMYWADTEEGFKAFYACLLALAKKEYQRRYPEEGKGPGAAGKGKRAKEKGKRDGRID